MSYFLPYLTLNNRIESFQTILSEFTFFHNEYIFSSLLNFTQLIQLYNAPQPGIFSIFFTNTSTDQSEFIWVYFSSVSQSEFTFLYCTLLLSVSQNLFYFYSPPVGQLLFTCFYFCHQISYNLQLVYFNLLCFCRPIPISGSSTSFLLANQVYITLLLSAS